MIRRWTALVLIAVASAACRPRVPVPYPPSVESDFRPRCAEEYQRLGANASPEVTAARCDCVLRQCEAMWSFEKFVAVIRNIDTGRYRYRYVSGAWGWVPVEIGTTFPNEMLTMMAECRLTIADEPP
jgi:hypothetical protein